MLRSRINSGDTERSEVTIEEEVKTLLKKIVLNSGLWSPAKLDDRIEEFPGRWYTMGCVGSSLQIIG